MNFIKKQTLLNHPTRLKNVEDYTEIAKISKIQLTAITRLVAKLFNAPYAAIHFLDDKYIQPIAQYNKNKFSFNHILIQDSFCYYTLNKKTETPFIVNNTKTDRRFQNIAYVKQGIHFYAGIKLKTVENQLIGSLCVMDTYPKLEIDPELIERLYDLSSITLKEIETIKLKYKTEHIERRLNDVLEHLPQGLAVFDKNDYLVIANKSLRDSLPEKLAQEIYKKDIRYESIIKKVISDGYHFSNSNKNKQFIKELIKRHKTPTESFEIKTKNNQIIKIIEHLTPSGDIISQQLNVTKKRLKEEEAYHQSIMREAIAKTAMDAIITINHKGIILEFNHAAECIFGFKAKDVINTPLLNTIIPKNMRKAHTAGLKKYLKTRKTNIMGKRLELKAIKNNGEEIDVELMISPIEVNQEVYFTAYLKDISETKQYQKVLQDAKEKAEMANIAKTDFLANMSHEIRTPLNGIIGALDLLMEEESGFIEELSDEKKHLLNTARRSSETLLVLINDLLDISRIEAGTIKLKQTAFYPRSLLMQARDLFETSAHEKGISLLMTPIKEPPLVYGDPDRIRQILFNLISNAIKFTETGIVEIGVESEIINKTHCQIVYNVKDQGPGIDEDKINLIFERFKQIDGARTRKYGGMGLGLAISKELVEIMKGSIEVMPNSDGKGTLFRFSIPLKIAPKTLAPKENEHLTHHKVKKKPASVQKIQADILLAEDSPTNALVATALLKQTGANITHVTNGIKAIEALKTQNFDLILMDVSMPEMDGLDATRIITKNISKLVRPPILALTAHVLAEDKILCIQAGMDGYLSKPINKNELLSETRFWVQPDHIISKDSVQEIWGEDMESYLMVGASFIEELYTRFESLRKALHQNDRARIKLEVHAVKGISANIGANLLSKTAAEIEEKTIHEPLNELLNKICDLFKYGHAVKYDLVQQGVLEILNQTKPEFQIKHK